MSTACLCPDGYLWNFCPLHTGRILNRAGRSPWMRGRPGAGPLVSWYRIENKSAPRASVHIYDEIGMWGISANDFVSEFKAIKSNAIDVHINSPGGEVYDGLAIHSTIKNHPAHVTVYIDGMAFSAASFIAMAGDTVKIARNAEIMIHDALAATFGNAADHAAMVDRLSRCSDNIADIYAQRAGGDVAQWRERMAANERDGTSYIGQEAVDAGLADEVTGEVSDDDAERAKNHYDRLSLFARRPVPTDAVDGAADDSTDEPTVGASGGSARAVDESPGPDASTPSATDPATTTDDAKIENLEVFDLGLLRDAMDGATREPEPPAPLANLGELVALTMQTVIEQEAPAPDPPDRVPTQPAQPVDRLSFEDALREVIYQ